MTQTPLVELRHVSKSFTTPKGTGFKALDNINLIIPEREIVGLLGRSGCGKSTLLRIIAGLIPVTEGEALYRGKAIDGPLEDVTMVFQSFALFPWLTVLQNVETGLEATGVPAPEMEKRAVAAIDLIGLDGFETAYPKELSGGMRQRVGFARAMVVNPAILLMDEPFSALDVLTAETLRTDFIDLWMQAQLPINSVVMVTHSIEDAVSMCDRIFLLSSNPGRVDAEIPVDIKHPRERNSPEFRRLVDTIYTRMTTKVAGKTATAAAREPFPGNGIYMVLPRMATNRISGLIETIAAEPYHGKADLPPLAAQLQMEVDDIFPIADVLQLLRFAEVTKGDVILTDTGRKFFQMEVDDRKKLFAAQLLAHVPLAAHIRHVLDERPDHIAPFNRFRQELEDQMQKELAEQTLRTVITWSRYAEIFAYNEGTRRLSIELPPEDTDAPEAQSPPAA